jgi:hypothetical protein
MLMDVRSQFVALDSFVDHLLSSKYGESLAQDRQVGRRYAVPAYFGRWLQEYNRDPEGAEYKPVTF